MRYFRNKKFDNLKDFTIDRAGNEKSAISNVIYDDKDNLGPISHARRA